MKIQNSFRISLTKIWIILISVVIYLSQLHSFFGEDIVNARNNFLGDEKTDFWGGISTVVYGNIPTIFGVRWQILLALIQIFLAATGLLLIFRTFSDGHQIKPYHFLLVYLVLIFSVQMTRDGTMFSLMLLGVAILNSIEKFQKKKFWKTIGIIIIIFGLSFRPWVSIALVPVILFLLHKYRKQLSIHTSIGISLIVVFMPILLEVSTTNLLNLQKSYPEQQVMIMDVTASYCYSNNFESGIKSRKLIQIFSNSPNVTKEICQFFRADTWISLTKNSKASTEGLQTNFGLIPVGDERKYQALKQGWIELIAQDPVTYFQNKVVFAGKLIIGSDSRNFSWFRPSLSGEFLSSVVRIPFDVAVAIHALSIAAVVLFLFFFPFVKSIRNRTGYVRIDFVNLVMFLALTLWASLSVIAYVGSNGRYSYSITLIVLTLLASTKLDEK